MTPRTLAELAQLLTIERHAPSPTRYRTAAEVDALGDARRDQEAADSLAMDYSPDVTAARRKALDDALSGFDIPRATIDLARWQAAARRVA